MTERYFLVRAKINGEFKITKLGDDGYYYFFGHDANWHKDFIRDNYNIMGEFRLEDIPLLEERGNCCKCGKVTGQKVSNKEGTMQTYLCRACIRLYIIDPNHDFSIGGEVVKHD